MATNTRGHTVPAAGETPSRAAIFGALLTVNDIVPVANTTARQQLVADLTAAGRGPTPSRPLYVTRADAVAGRELEYTTNGTTFRTVATAHGTQRAGSVAVGSPGTSGGGEVTVAFATPMPTANFAVTITDTNVGAGIGMIFWKVRAKTVNGFIARAMPASGATPVVGLTTTFDYVAVATDL